MGFADVQRERANADVEKAKDHDAKQCYLK